MILLIIKTVQPIKSSAIINNTLPAISGPVTGQHEWDLQRIQVLKVCRNMIVWCFWLISGLPSAG